MVAETWIAVMVTPVTLENFCHHLGGSFRDVADFNNAKFRALVGGLWQASTWRRQCPQRMMGICVDVTDRKRAEDIEKLLTAELQHRMRNLFAVVQAIAQGTLRGGPIADNAREAFMGRLQALSRNDLRLASSAWSGAKLSDIVSSELGHVLDRIKLNGGGDQVFLTPQAAQNFALAIHELATNAAKYGSLSKPGGEVLLGWLDRHQC